MNAVGSINTNSQTLYIKDGNKVHKIVLCERVDNQEDDSFETESGVKQDNLKKNEGFFSKISSAIGKQIDKFGELLGMYDSEQTPTPEKGKKPEKNLQIEIYKNFADYDENNITFFNNPFVDENTSHDITSHQSKIIEFPVLDADKNEEDNIADGIKPVTTGIKELNNSIIKKVRESVIPNSSHKTVSIDGEDIKISQSENEIILNTKDKSLALGFMPDKKGGENLHLAYFDEKNNSAAAIVCNKNGMKYFNAAGKANIIEAKDMIYSAIDLAEETFGSGFDYEKAENIIKNI